MKKDKVDKLTIDISEQDDCVTYEVQPVPLWAKELVVCIYELATKNKIC